MAQGAEGGRTLILGGTLLTPWERLEGYTLVVERERIVDILPRRPSPARGDILIDATDQWVTPGLIDLHLHGAAGREVMEAQAEALQAISRFLPSHGVTAFLPTTVSAPFDATLAAVQAVASCGAVSGGARILGLHLEGPFLNPAYRGAQPAEALRPADWEEFCAWLKAGPVRLVTLAPEVQGALVLMEKAAGRGVAFSLGHSGATLRQVQEALERGLRQASHVFNAMAGLHHRDPGTLGAVMAEDRIFAQVIVDGVHVHPAMVKVLVRAKGRRRTVLISDSIGATGMPDGSYALGGRPVFVRDGIPRDEQGALAGSTLTLDRALRNVMEFCGLSLSQALPMATAVPAEALGMQGEIGALTPGAYADIVLFDQSGRVTLTMVGGEVCFRA